MRIIAGERRGKILRSVRGMATRPTADRVRESVFNILAYQVAKSAVLDLFAGTGAMGIEALSRGAEYAVFVDDSRDAVSVISKNLEDCRFQDRAKVIRHDIAKNLSCLSEFEDRFDLVFTDPPYSKNLIQPALIHLSNSRCLKQAALIVIEHGLSEAVSEKFLKFYLTDQRKYGKTLVSFFRYDMNL